jgi:chemotaxis protein CheZ
MSLAVARQADLRMREPQAVIAELIEIADYIAHLREEIGALRANEMSRDRIPMAHEELGSVVAATAGATNTIMEAAEAMLGLPDGPGYRDAVEERINTIFEACAFQDITGQRIAKVVESLRLFEQRLARFVGAVKARARPPRPGGGSAAQRPPGGRGDTLPGRHRRALRLMRRSGSPVRASTRWPRSG